MGEVNFLTRARRGLVRQEVINFTGADVDLGIYFTFANPGNHHLVTDLFAEIVPLHAVFFNGLTHLGRRDFLVGRDPVERLTEFVVFHPDTRLLGLLHLGALGNHLIQHLAANDLGGR